jgi:Golgi nucleoside diphosphatase
MGMGKWVCHSTRDNDDNIHHNTSASHDHRATSDNHRAASDDHNCPCALAVVEGVGDPAFADTLLVPKHSGV